MKKYQEPEIEITNFQAEDILVVSGAIPEDGFDIGEGDWE